MKIDIFITALEILIVVFIVYCLYYSLLRYKSITTQTASKISIGDEYIKKKYGVVAGFEGPEQGEEIDLREERSSSLVKPDIVISRIVEGDPFVLVTVYKTGEIISMKIKELNENYIKKFVKYGN